MLSVAHCFPRIKCLLPVFFLLPLAGCQSVGEAQKPAASSQEIMSALSLAVSINLAKTCPKQFEMTNDAQRLAEGESLKAKIGQERFNAALQQLKPPPDCQVARKEAQQLSGNFPYSIIK